MHVQQTVVVHNIQSVAVPHTCGYSVFHVMAYISDVL